MRKPPCSRWNVWVGPEVEGSTDIAQPTVFVRELGKVSLDDLRLVASRIWFCADYAHHHPSVVRRALKMFPKVCVEVFAGEKVPADIHRRASVYWKIDFLGERPGDHVCFGPAYNDESFVIGTGEKVTPQHYLKDERIA